jgi:Mn-dependent DtxR family transcriptional regulator
MNQIFDENTPATQPRFTTTQGQYLAFIYAYTRVLARPPAEADMQRHFKVTAPTVHQMVLTLERNGPVKREPGIARSIQLMIAPEALPILR